MSSWGLFFKLYVNVLVVLLAIEFYIYIYYYCEIVLC